MYVDYYLLAIICNLADIAGHTITLWQIYKQKKLVDSYFPFYALWRNTSHNDSTNESDKQSSYILLPDLRMRNLWALPLQSPYSWMYAFICFCVCGEHLYELGKNSVWAVNASLALCKCVRALACVYWYMRIIFVSLRIFMLAFNTSITCLFFELNWQFDFLLSESCL